MGTLGGGKNNRRKEKELGNVTDWRAIAECVQCSKLPLSARTIL